LEKHKRIDYANHLFNFKTDKAREAALFILEQGIESGDITFPKLICEMRIRLADISLASVNKILNGKRPLTTDDEIRAHADYQHAQMHLNAAIDIKDDLMGEAPSSWLYKVSVQIAFLRKINKKLTSEMRSIHVSPTNFMTSPAPVNDVWERLLAEESSVTRLDPKRENPYKGAIRPTPRHRRDDTLDTAPPVQTRNWFMSLIRSR
jgi:hypothetical protein